VVGKVSTITKGLQTLIYNDHKKKRERPNYFTVTGKNYGNCDDADSDSADGVGIKMLLNRKLWL